MATIDTSEIKTSEIKAKIALSDVVEHYLGAPVKRGGRWAWWHCPFHADRRRPNLGVTDDNALYNCFTCSDVRGDHFSFVMRYKGLDFRAAAEELAALAGVLPQRDMRLAVPRSAPPAAAAQPPSAAWQAMGRRALLYAQRQLWGEAGQAKQAHLAGRTPMQYLAWRGLSEDTISAWNLGYMPKAHYISPSQWGLDRDRDVWIPQGFCFPGEVDGTLWYLKFRTAGGEPKYYMVPGGSTALLGADRFRPRCPLALCEGEIDAYLVHQEASDLVDAATLGGAAKGRRGSVVNLGRWLPRMMGHEVILLPYDSDEAGLAAGREFAAASRRIHRVRVPHGTDVGEFVQAGGDLRAWLAGELRALGCAVPEREEFQPGYPVFLTFAPGPGLALPSGQWWATEDGRIEAVFNGPAQLEATLWATKAVGIYAGLRAGG